MDTMTLTDFLLARIAEDEAAWGPIAGRIAPWSVELHEWTTVTVDPARILARCEADRRIVEACTTPMPRFGQLPEDYERVPTDRDDILRALALPYADHPDYRDEWRP